MLLRRRPVGRTLEICFLCHQSVYKGQTGVEFWLLRFRDLGVFVFEFWVLRFRVLGASFLRFGCSFPQDFHISDSISSCNSQITFLPNLHKANVSDR